MHLEKLYNESSISPLGFSVPGIWNNGKMKLILKNEPVFAKKYSRLIKKIINERIGLYGPSSKKSAYQYICQRLQSPVDKKIRESLEKTGDTDLLEKLVKELMVEHAYYLLVHDGYIQRLIMGKLNVFNENDISVQEKTDYIREALEKNSLGILKKFQERSSFKTFLYTLTARLFYDSWRAHYKAEGTWGKFFNDLRDNLVGNPGQPLENLLNREKEDLYGRCMELLPSVLAELGEKERLALKMKYEKELNLSSIAGTLGCSRYKAGLLLKHTEYNIKERILWALNGKGGSHETSER